jgi:predicted N-acyltransferase
MTNIQVSIVHRISDIAPSVWDALSEGEGPFLRHGFLNALEQSECCNSASGWQPMHIMVKDNDQIVVLVPGYLKTHSYGEYVFDQGWANAYHQHGISYYPKWIAAIPFTPVTGARMLVKRDYPVTAALISHIQATIKAYDSGVVSSMHWLFTNSATQAHVSLSKDVLTRYAVQFQWHNYDYNTFDDFLNALTARKRKEIRKTEKRHREAGISFTHTCADAIDNSVVAFFVKCYQSTYLKRSGHLGYLNQAFFEQLCSAMAQNLLFVTAYEDETPVACALFLFDASGLYGRYWGALKEIDGLHFAACYFEGIKFAIRQRLPLFNPGTQGEHKLLRGFEPIYCQSQHALFHPSFHQAVAEFLQQESREITQYFNQAKNVLPFNSLFTPKLKTTSVSDPLLSELRTDTTTTTMRK